MATRIQRWGNSLAVRIPKALAEEAHLGLGCAVDVTVVDGSVVVTPSADPHYTLQELLAGVTKDNIHGEVGTGPAVGREAW
jgi:antitoxin MazE